VTKFLLLVVVAFGVALRRAFTRIEQLERASELARERPAPSEAQSSSTRAPQDVSPSAARGFSPAPISPEPPPDSRGFRLQAEETERPADELLLPPGGGGDRSERTEAEGPTESLETQIGTRWLLYIGILAIVIGVAYFEKLAIDNRWIGETARVIQGGVLGLVLTYVGLRFVRSGYALYGQMITGGGAAILYLSTYAAFNFYHLIDRPAAFALMIAITGMVTWLADRQQSQGLALFAAGGGFGTPFLLPGSTDAQMALFGYDAILIGGTVLLSRRRDWPLLNIVSYVFTLATVATWADAFYTTEKFLATELWITLFCAMFLDILRTCRRSTAPGAALSAIALTTAPAAYYAASLAILFPHPTALLLWLVMLMLTGGIVSARLGAGPGLAVWGTVALPLLIWTVTYAGRPGWLVPGLATVGAVYTIALAAQLQASLERDEFSPPAVVWLHLNGLLMFAGAYFMIGAVHHAITGTVAGAFGLWQWGLAAFLLTRRRDQAVHFAALGFTLMSIATALQFDGPPVTIGWAAEGAAVIALGIRERRAWLRVAGTVLFAIAVARVLDLMLAEAPLGHVVLVNAQSAAGAFIAALAYLLAWLHSRTPESPEREFGLGASILTAQVVVLVLLTSEIHAYWALREWAFQRELTVSVTWAAYATALILIGLRRGYAPIRYFAIGLFALTIVKVFMVDLAQLERLYRVISIVGLGVALLLTSYLYQRKRGTATGIPPTG
jgi:uncharacterized membrane protein